MHVKPLNQIGLTLTITNYMEISSKNKKEEFEQIKPRNLWFFFSTLKQEIQTKPKALDRRFWYSR